jgi:hypothetical protein
VTTEKAIRKTIVRPSGHGKIQPETEEDFARSGRGNELPVEDGKGKKGDLLMKIKPDSYGPWSSNRGRH